MGDFGTHDRPWRVVYGVIIGSSSTNGSRCVSGELLEEAQVVAVEEVEISSRVCHQFAYG